MKFVLDTNILISGSFWESPSAELLEAAVRKQVVLVLSPELLAEFGSVISRTKFAGRLAAKAADPEKLMRALARQVIIVTPKTLPLPPELRDPKDLAVLACAVSGQADAIVSGDKDLLILGEFRGIPILSDREALKRLTLARE